MRRFITPNENHRPIRAFVATKRTQGLRESDFCHARVGEVVRWALECDCDRGDIDGSCGCRRSMSGVEHGFATTTFEVAEVDMNEKEFVDLYVRSHSGGIAYERLKALAEEELEQAAYFPLGVALERRGHVIQTRENVPAGA